MNRRLSLANGVKMPQLGLGVYGAEDGAETENAALWALEAGYRHIDTAAVYGNERSVGMALRKSAIARDKLFITGKIWNASIRAGETRDAFSRTLENLGLDYLDLCLLHWPVEGRENAWETLAQLCEDKLIRAIGVSNFQLHHLNSLIQTTGIRPMFNQIESHPLMSNQELIDACQKAGIAVGAWSPLGGPRLQLLQHPALMALATAYGRTPAQIVLRWDMQRGIAAVPKSVHRERIISNSRIFDFALADKDMHLIQALDQGLRVGPDPDNFKF